MTLRNDIYAVLRLAQSKLFDMRASQNWPRKDISSYQASLRQLENAFDDIQTDNSAQYVIYTGIRAPHQYEGCSSLICEVCDESIDHPLHKEN